MATVDVVAATEEVPRTRLRVFADVPLPKTSVALPVTVNFSGVAEVPVTAAAYVTRAVPLNVPPAIVQLVAVASAFKLVSVPFERTRPVVATTPFSAVLPSFKLSVLAPKTSVALPVTVNVSPDEAYVTKAIALNVPPAIVQFAAVAFAFRL